MKFLSWLCYIFSFLVSYLSDYLMVATMNYLQVAPILVDIFILLIKHTILLSLSLKIRHVSSYCHLFLFAAHSE